MFVSAGAYARELDLSLYAETITNTILGIAHTFNKGPIGERTLITNIDRLVETFGEPISSIASASACQGWFAAREYLRNGNKLYVTRVDSVATPATYARMSIQGTTDQYVSTITDGTTSAAAVRTLTSAATDFAAAGVLVGDVVEVHDAVAAADNGFYVITNVAAAVITVDRDWPAGAQTPVDATVWTAKKEGGTNGVTSIPTTRQFTSVGATFQTNGVAEGDILKIADSGTTGDNGVYLVESVDSETQLTLNRDFVTGSLTALDYTIYGDIARANDGSTAAAGEFSSASAQLADHNVQAGDILYIHDAVDTACNGYYYITGLKGGSTDTTVTVNNATWTSALINLTYSILPGAVAFTGATKGTWCSGLLLSPKPNASYQNDKFDLELRDSTGSIVLERIYNMDAADVVTTMLSTSDYLTAAVLSNRSDFLTGTAFGLSGGNDGYSGIVDSDYIGNSVLGTGLRSFLNSEKVDINLLACPGVSSQNVQDELINICESRGDCFALIDPPDWSAIDSVNEILQFTNGLLTRTTALNSSYGGLWWTWQEVYDEYHNTDVWTAPSGHIAGVMAFNDNVKAPWYAPAGLKRGKLRGAKDLRYSPDQDDRESLQSGTARVNPIVAFTGEGIYAFGQKTLTTVTSALNRVNVRRMMLYVEKVIATAARQLIFEPNDAVLDREFKQLVEPVLDNVLSRRGIREYLIVAASTNTDRDNNKAVYKIFIKPMTTAETIEIQFALTSQGASFAELVELAA
jgi:phage tail sheath protein FI